MTLLAPYNCHHCMFKQAEGVECKKGERCWSNIQPACSKWMPSFLFERDALESTLMAELMEEDDCVVNTGRYAMASDIVAGRRDFV